MSKDGIVLIRRFLKPYNKACPLCFKLDKDLRVKVHIMEVSLGQLWFWTTGRDENIIFWKDCKKQGICTRPHVQVDLAVLPMFSHPNLPPCGLRNCSCSTALSSGVLPVAEKSAIAALRVETS